MSKSRRQFLTDTSLFLLGSAITFSGNAQQPDEVPPGMPSAFGVGPAFGPAVSTSSFAEAEKLMQVQMTDTQRAMAAATWRTTMAPVYERRTGPRKVTLEFNLAPASRWDPVLTSVKRLEAGAAKATINRSTQLLSQGYKLAIERRRLSMAPHIRHLTERGNAREGFFADYEVRSLLENLPSYLKDFALFAYLTGWRRGEIASLRWEDVDGDVIRLRGENSKNGEARSITLDGELAELMERRKSARQVKSDSTIMLADLVFHHDGQPIVDFRKSWATACKIAGVQGKLFHDFRRTAVRNMVRAGVPERVAMSISGHKTRSIFDRYNIVSERDLRDAMQRTQTYLLAAAARESDTKTSSRVRLQ